MPEYFIFPAPRRHERFLIITVFNLLLLLWFLLAAPTVFALQVTLGWDASSEPNLAGYRIYCGLSTRNYSVSYDAGKVYRYTVSGLQAGKTYYFAATAYDQYGRESNFSEEVTYVTAVSNNPPVASNGVLSTSEDTPASGTLSATDPDGNALSYSIATQGALGNAVITNAAGGTFTYTPKANVSGSDSFTFTVRDPGGLTATASIAVTILPVNDAPVAQDGILYTPRGVARGGVLIANDPDGSALTYTVVSQGAKGRAVITNSVTGAYTYTPNRGATGSDSFTFQVRDPGGLTASAVVTVRIISLGSTAFSAQNSSLNAAQGAIADGSSSPAEASVNPRVKIVLEAESGMLTAPMVLGKDPKAGGGRYIWVPNGKGNVADPLSSGGEAVYSFSVPAAGSYQLWGRIVANNVSNNSFFVSMDSGAGITWHTAIGSNNTWIWDQARDRNDPSPASFYLEAGEHTLVIKQMEDGTKLDSILITTQTGWMGETVYCDAEKRGTEGWEVFDAAPYGALISSVFDEERARKVIELSGSRDKNGYRLRSESLANWANTSQFVIEWSMKYDEKFVIYVEVQTTAGTRHLQYEPIGEDRPGRSNRVRLGLGRGAKNGRWHTFVRDLQADLNKAREDAPILQVNSFAIRGSGRVDGIKLRQTR